MKTTRIHHATTPKSIKLIRKLLAENNPATNNIKNKIVCIGEPTEIYKLQEFLSSDAFTFYASDLASPANIKEDTEPVLSKKEKKDSHE